jgi:sortase A
MSWLRNIERLLLIVGVLMLAVYVAARIHRTVLSKAELQRFKSQQMVSVASPGGVTLNTGTPDFSLWSEKRVKEYQESLAAHFAPAIGILRIPKIHVEVPILEGTDDLTLNRGVGHVAGTANPGENGNVAIAGHRDGFFRGLKDIVVGDQIEIATLQRSLTYTIDRITIVERTDLSVLQPRSHASLTLITCYPFYFIGSAPQRYIVQASASGSAGANDRAAVQSKLESESGALASTQLQDESVLIK